MQKETVNEKIKPETYVLQIIGIFEKTSFSKKMKGMSNPRIELRITASSRKLTLFRWKNIK
jgi:hypothetical protein